MGSKESITAQIKRILGGCGRLFDRQARGAPQPRLRHIAVPERTAGNCTVKKDVPACVMYPPTDPVKYAGSSLARLASFKTASAKWSNCPFEGDSVGSISRHSGTGKDTVGG